MPSQRLFVAFGTPPDVRLQILRIQGLLREARADVSWEGEAKMHCTLRFLGDTPAERIPGLEQALENLGNSSPPCLIRYHGTGVFPHARNPRVLWLGITDLDGALMALQQRLEEAVRSLGYAPEERPFQPHLTLGRVRSGRNITGLLGILKSVTFESQAITIQDIAVIRSELLPAGSRYSVAKTVPLIGKTGRSQ